MHEIRVVLADEQRAFAEALAMRLDQESSIRVVAVVTRPDEVLRAVRVAPVDLAVLTVDRSSGLLDAGPLLTAARPGLRLVGVAEADDVVTMARAVRAGFRAWVPKDVGICVLLDVMHAVCRGETCIPAGSLTRLLQHLLNEQEEKRHAEEPLAALTSREQQVLRAMCTGATRDEIARQLSISTNTVRTHTQSILTKLGVHTSLAAVTLARRAGVG